MAAHVLLRGVRDWVSLVHHELGQETLLAVVGNKAGKPPHAKKNSLLKLLRTAHRPLSSSFSMLDISNPLVR